MLFKASSHLLIWPEDLPALAERKSPDERPQAAVQANRGGQTEDPDDPNS